MRILGVTASSLFFPPTKSYDLIETAILASNAANITFDVSNFTTEYKHLQIRGVGRVTSSTNIRALDIRFNGDTGANYSGHIVIGDGAIYSGGSANITNAGGFYITGNGSPSGAFGAGTIDILDAFSTTKFKTVRTLGGQTGYNIMNFSSSAWRNTNPITTIQIYPQASEIFGTDTRFSIYGIKG